MSRSRSRALGLLAGTHVIVAQLIEGVRGSGRGGQGGQPGGRGGAYKLASLHHELCIAGCGGIQ